MRDPWTSVGLLLGREGRMYAATDVPADTAGRLYGTAGTQLRAPSPEAASNFRIDTAVGRGIYYLGVNAVRLMCELSAG